MNCRELCEQLLEFLSGELDPDCCEEIRQHLTQCPPCEAYYKSYRITVTISRKLPARQMSVTFAEKLKIMICSKKKPSE